MTSRHTANGRILAPRLSDGPGRDVRGRAHRASRTRPAPRLLRRPEAVPATGRPARHRSARTSSTSQGEFADYPPGYLYVLWLTGKLTAGSRLSAAEAAADRSPISVSPGSPARSPRGSRPHSLKRAVAGASTRDGGRALQPCCPRRRAVWGQVDSVPAFLVLTLAPAAVHGPQSGLRSELAGAPHLRRRDRDEAAGGLHGPGHALRPLPPLSPPPPARGSCSTECSASSWPGSSRSGSGPSRGWRSGSGPSSLVDFYSKSASVYPVTSANAFNLWGVVGFWRPDSKGGECTSDLAGTSPPPDSECSLLPRRRPSS